MSAKLEAFLAKLLVDKAFHARFLAEPRAEAAGQGLDERETEAVLAIDRTGLKMAASSVRRKARPKPRS